MASPELYRRCARLLNAYQEIPAPEQYMQQARTWQTSIGLQRQFLETMSVDVDYIYSQGRFEKDTIDNVNLTYVEATGVNIPYTNRAALPYPEYGIISMIPHNTRSGYHGLQTSFTKRMRQRWQAWLPIRCRGSRTRRTNRSAGSRSSRLPSPRTWGTSTRWPTRISDTGRCSAPSGTWARGSR